MKTIYLERVTPTETPTLIPPHMTQSQRLTAQQGALLSTCTDAFTVFEVVANIRREGALTPDVLAVAHKQLDLLERRAQDIEADIASASLPTDVWFDLPPNEWWNAN